MKICIVGTGAIGVWLGARLAASGRADVCALARGAALAALRKHGWRLAHGDGVLQAPVRASDDPRELGPQDLVLIAVKAPALAAVARTVSPLLGRDTTVMPAMNGVPWWFTRGVPALGDSPLRSIDPDGSIAQALAFERVLACVVHASVLTVEPGMARHQMGSGLIIGEPAGGRSERTGRMAGILSSAGFDVTQSDDVRRDIWYKLWGNMTMNPVCALTGATADRVLADPLVREFSSGAMREAARIGALIGCPVDNDPEDRHRITARLGAFKPSMLQDVEAGRAIELDGLVGVVRELGQRLSIPTPHIDALFGLTRLFGSVRGLYRV